MRCKLKQSSWVFWLRRENFLHIDLWHIKPKSVEVTANKNWRKSIREICAKLWTVGCYQTNESKPTQNISLPGEGNNTVISKIIYCNVCIKTRKIPLAPLASICCQHLQRSRTHNGCTSSWGNVLSLNHSQAKLGKCARRQCCWPSARLQRVKAQIRCANVSLPALNRTEC